MNTLVLHLTPSRDCQGSPGGSRHCAKRTSPTAPPIYDDDIITRITIDCVCHVHFLPLQYLPSIICPMSITFLTITFVASSFRLTGIHRSGDHCVFWFPRTTTVSTCPLFPDALTTGRQLGASHIKSGLHLVSYGAQVAVAASCILTAYSTCTGLISYQL